MIRDPQFQLLAAGVFGLLIVASIATRVVRAKASEASRASVENLEARVRSWWAMVALLLGAVAMGKVGAILLFALISFLALREFVTAAPPQRADHRALFWMFFVILPAQYVLLSIEWYGLFAIFIPVYVFLFIPARLVIAGDPKNFLARASELQWGTMACVYLVSHAPALLMLPIKGYEGENGKLLLFMLFVAQISDVFQYVWGKSFGKRKIAPTISPGKTVEGFVGGVLSASVAGAALWWATPFAWWQAGLFSLAMAIAGFFGDVTMSAIKRDRGIKDFGALIPGHGGVLDRIDSLCFASPIFFHLTRYWFT
jgi:phosphatidate cytidylyltransferase